MENKSYELRKLQSADIFIMSKIISKIGVSELRNCFNAEDMKQITGSQEDILQQVGIGVALEVANVVLTNVPKAEQEIYSFLSSLSGKEPKEIEELDMVTFAQMLVDVFRKEEFKGFIGVVSGLFK